MTDTLTPPTAGGGASTPTTVPLGDVSNYRTAAQGYITSYREAALTGIEDFKNSLTPDNSFDWPLFGAQVAGNVIWAAACFTTGGAAFVISLGGIALTTAAAAGSVSSAPSFKTKTTASINDVDRYLQDQVDRVTSDVHAQGVRAHWDDNRARLEILQRMFAPTFISRGAGGLPNADAPAIEAAVQQQLLIRANATQPRSGSAGRMATIGLVPTIIREYGGYLMYSYGVGNIEHDEGFFYHNTMNDIGAWRLTSGLSAALVPSANVGDINVSMNSAQHNLHGEAMHGASWPCRKAINLFESKPEDPTVIVKLSASNAVVGVEGWGVVHDYLENHDPIGFGQRIATRVWGDSSPPDVARLAAPPDLFEANTSPSFGP